MIGSLRGRLVFRDPPLLMVDVQGVGYEVEAPASTFDRQPHNKDWVIEFPPQSLRAL